METQRLETETVSIRPDREVGLANLDRQIGLAKMEKMVRFTVVLRPHAAQLVDRYSEREDAGVPIDPTIDLSSIATASHRPR
ncbi:MULTISPECIES: hypothetical protein [unclassified Sphingomonas]|uniref:hypothetical protein n=1 Tax=Sphingomonas sp. Ant20 TaxID=104605 RepID=UPI0004DF78E2|nr:MULTISPECIES: hypothetical protein [unclassified Sphingomonas]KHA64361.1 hypothetical protein NI18_09750 [Sphingomonas sp. Ant20]MBD8471834.1 hypothetical protein [Sphingomonas sp. CFBP 8765]MDY1010092.1 hypothetical protein [Sphingomonas sp. CFBP9019]